MRFRIDLTVDGFVHNDVPEGEYPRTHIEWRPAKVVETIYWKDPSNQLMQPATAINNLISSIAQAFAQVGFVNIMDEDGCANIYMMQHLHKIQVRVDDGSASPN